MYKFIKGLFYLTLTFILVFIIGAVYEGSKRTPEETAAEIAKRTAVMEKEFVKSYVAAITEELPSAKEHKEVVAEAQSAPAEEPIDEAVQASKAMQGELDLNDANAELNKVWKSFTPEQRKGLLPEQREWLQERAASCHMEHPDDQNAQYSCMANMTRQRTEGFEYKMIRGNQ